jgi:hypothetical protein
MRPGADTIRATEFFCVHRQDVSALPALLVGSHVKPIPGEPVLTFDPRWSSRPNLIERTRSDRKGRFVSDDPGPALKAQ